MNRRGSLTLFFILYLVDSFKLQAAVQSGNNHVFADRETAGERRLIICFGLSGVVIPDFAIGTLAVPAKVSVRDCFEREKLKAAKQAVIFRHCNAPS